MNLECVRCMAKKADGEPISYTGAEVLWEGTSYCYKCLIEQLRHNEKVFKAQARQWRL